MKNWIKFTSFILLTATILVMMNTFVFTGEMMYSQYSQFFKEEENSLDIVFVGNSTVRHGIIPTEIWHDHQVTSYSLNNSPSHPEVISLAIDEIARLQNPKLVMIDITGLTFQSESNEEFHVEEFLGSMPNSKHKEEIKSNYDYFDSNDELFANHNDFRNPEYFNFLTNKNKYLKGYTPSYKKAKINESKINVDNTVLSLPKAGQMYLNKILETCAKYPEINFVFVRLPRVITESSIEETYMLRSAIPSIENYGYEYIEFEKYYDQIGLNHKDDFFDEIHLNYYGAVKFTKFLIPFLEEKYDIIGNEHSQSVKDNFNNAYSNYEKKIKNKH